MVVCTLAGCSKDPIETAVSKNDRAAVAEAVKAGADVNEKVSGGDTPLIMAVKSGESSSAQGLIEAGADIKVHDSTGNGVLHYAARSGMTGICGLLVDRGIAVDEKGAGGATALQFAILGARQETAKYLVRRGASLGQKDDCHRSESFAGSCRAERAFAISPFRSLLSTLSGSLLAARRATLHLAPPLPDED